MKARTAVPSFAGALSVALLVAALFLPTSPSRAQLGQHRMPSASPPLAAEFPTTAHLDDTHRVDAGKTLHRLTLFPILASKQSDLGDFVTLDAALEAKQAEVREMPGASVGTLVIQNKGGKPILVLAGTVVKGGKQDRQIGQDFVITPDKTVPVDAFCVEHGRWHATREGRSTGGKFSGAGLLAPRKVRGAAQYERDQGKVWEKVAEVNASTVGKVETGTLLATIDDEEVAKRRAQLEKDARAYLDGHPHKKDIVGIAYAVDGEVRALRFFASHGIFQRFHGTLLKTAALEAVTGAKPREDGKDATVAAVVDFVRSFAKERAKETRSAGPDSANDYYENADGYKAECVLQKAGKKRWLTVDFSKK